MSYWKERRESQHCWVLRLLVYHLADSEKCPELPSTRYASSILPCSSTDKGGLAQNSKYKPGDNVIIKGSQYSNPKSFIIAQVYGDGQYKLAQNSGHKFFDDRVYLERDLVLFSNFENENQNYDVVQPLTRTESIRSRSRGVAEQQRGRGSLQNSVQKVQKKTVESEPGLSYKIANDDGPSAESTGEDSDEFEPSTYHKRTNVHKLSEAPSSEILIGVDAQDFVEDTALATGHGTKLTETGSVLSRFFARGAFGRLCFLPSLSGARGWNSKSLLSLPLLEERPLEKGKTRVRWRCVCGRKMYDDFIELRPGAAAEFEKWLKYSIRNHAHTDASNPSQDATSRASTSSSAAVSGQQPTSGSDISLQRLSGTASTIPDSKETAAITIDVHLEKCWLLICGQPRRGPDSLLAQLDLSLKPSDKELFDGMKKSHSSLRNTFTLQPVLKGVRTIRFVQASLVNRLL